MRIGAVTTGRADYAILRPLLRELAADPAFDIALLVTGAHGDEIARDKFRQVIDIPCVSDDDDPRALSQIMAKITEGVGKALADSRPDLIVLAGDRYEMLAAAQAALPFAQPLVHLHGGELTACAFDDAIRHALTKLSHLHFVAHDEAANRLVRMGEEPWRVTVMGAPSLDNIRHLRHWPREEIEARLGIPRGAEFILATFHSTTLQYNSTMNEAEEWLEALGTRPEWIVLTGANADTYGRRLNDRYRAFAESHPRCRYHHSLGTEAYIAALSSAKLMCGNSSSGLIEAPSFRLPVVDVGRRQENRLRAANVVHAEATFSAVKEAMDLAGSLDFRARLSALVNPYDRGGAARLFHSRLSTVCLGPDLVIKKFFDTKEKACE